MAARSPARNTRAASPLSLVLVPIAVLFGISLVPRVADTPRLQHIFWLFGGVLVALWALLRQQVIRKGRALEYRFVPVLCTMCSS